MTLNAAIGKFARKLRLSLGLSLEEASEVAHALEMARREVA